MNSRTLFIAFMQNARELNKNLGITPLLFGSLGLQLLVEENLNCDDIDILIPEIFIGERWEEFKAFLDSKGYVLIDLHEHTFTKDNISYSYASIEGLYNFVGINIDDFDIKSDNQICYYQLNLLQYLTVYEKSSLDGYRINKKEKKDKEKVELIKSRLQQKSKS